MLLRVWLLRWRKRRGQRVGNAGEGARDHTRLRTKGGNAAAAGRPAASRAIRRASARPRRRRRNRSARTGRQAEGRAR
ncbi:hypothetical protein DA2_0997 [Desulfovibrio sp. A2]|nr:hypothetical protein DA2_0997 [Desulfovibrio sp. A2]